MRNKEIIKTFNYVLILTSLILSNDVLDGQTINDDDKCSGRGEKNIILGVETVTKIRQIKKVQGGIKKVKKVKGVKDLKKIVIDEATKKLLVYKNGKAHIMPTLKKIQEKTSKIIEKCNKKINEWRNTLPTLKGYFNSAKNICNSNIKTFNDFRPKDLIDIDRKWSRNLDRNVMNGVQTVYNFSRWVKNRYYSVNKKERTKLRLRELEERIIPSENDLMNSFAKNDEDVIAFIEAYNLQNESDKLPKTTMYDCVNSITLIQNIMDYAYDIDNTGKTKQQKDLEMIANGFEEGNKKTLQDDQELSVLINTIRRDVEIQKTEIEQINTNLQILYARLKQIDLENKALAYEEVYDELDMFNKNSDLNYESYINSLNLN